jgi:hypothetical protein
VQESGRPAESQPGTTLPPAPKQAQQATPPGQVTLTPDEIQRRIQSEADRLLARRQKEEAEKAKREREVELRRTNPFEYARLKESEEQELLAAQTETKRLTEMIGTQLTMYDRNILDPLVSALPEKLRKDVISAEEGIPGRKATVTNTIKALRSHWMAEGRASAKSDLMKDQTFIKEVLARFGTPSPEPEPTPVRLGATSGQPGQNTNQRMNSWMRSGAQQARSTG